MTAVFIRKLEVYRSRMDSSDVFSVTKVLKLHILERKPLFLLFHGWGFTTVRLRACISPFPPDSSIKTVLNQSAKNQKNFCQRNQTPQKRARFRSWGSLWNFSCLTSKAQRMFAAGIYKYRLKSQTQTTIVVLMACSWSYAHEYEHLYASSAFEHSTVSTGLEACILASTMPVWTSMTVLVPMNTLRLHWPSAWACLYEYEYWILSDAPNAWIPVSTLSLRIDLAACSCSYETAYEHMYASSALGTQWFPLALRPAFEHLQC